MHQQQEARALQELKNQEFRAILPSFTHRDVHRGAFREREEPLFPGYLLIWLDIHERCQRWRSVNGTRGVQRLLGPTERPTPLDEAWVEANVLKPRLLLDDTVLGAKKGDELDVVSGPWAGNSGVLQRFASKRVFALLDTLGGERVVSLPLDHVRRRARGLVCAPVR